ncbi:MAG: DUF255 domain-containing protein [Microbacteriaceae bacterium]
MGNRLSDAISPYLRSHADNPVNWYPWGEEAFELARSQDRPVLISIGYSSCHWCHVMARESFSDSGIAAVLNERFVAIKVDREEHPDVDASYMAAASAYTEDLGWPLTVFATPEGKTFFAGSYFPPEPAHGLPSFRQLLEAILDAWKNRRALIEEQSEQLRIALTSGKYVQTTEVSRDGAGIETHTHPEQSSVMAPDALLEQWVPRFLALEDPLEGGFGRGSKFPNAPSLAFLSEVVWHFSANAEATDAQALLSRTLQRMGSSELRDPIEGGFFRYTVQRNFLEPHYERMLYDNAQLLELYSLAALSTDVKTRESSVVVAEGIAKYLLDVLQQDQGGFATAQDSESLVNGAQSEGGYYRLNRQERAAQPAPKLDRKVLTGWNGLAIAALVRASRRLGHPEWLLAAQNAADALIEHHVFRESSGSIRLHRASEGARLSTASATLEDYGFFADGLIELALAFGRRDYLVLAQELIGVCVSNDGGGFLAPGLGDPVLIKQGTLFRGDQADAALPSALSAIALAAQKLFVLNGDQRLRDALLLSWREMAPNQESFPLAAASALLLELRLGVPPSQLIIVTKDAAPTASVIPPTDPFLIQENTSETVQNDAHKATFDTLVTRFPELSKISLAQECERYSVAVVLSETEAQIFAAAGFEIFEGKTAIDGQDAVYRCHDFFCELPISLVRFIEQSAATQ